MKIGTKFAIFLVAALTMRQWSEEERTGTLEILLTMPTRTLQLVLGKFLGVLGLVAVALGLTLFIPLSVSLLGHLDWGPVAGGYLAAMVGMDPQWLQANGVSNLDLAGIIPISGQMTTHFNVKKMLGDAGPMYRPLITPEAPLYHCSSNLPPICLITGDRKIEWKCRVEENQLLAVSLKAVGCPRVEFHEVPKENHGSIGVAAMPIVRKFIGLDVE